MRTFCRESGGGAVRKRPTPGALLLRCEAIEVLAVGPQPLDAGVGGEPLSALGDDLLALHDVAEGSSVATSSRSRELRSTSLRRVQRVIARGDGTPDMTPLANRPSRASGNPPPAGKRRVVDRGRKGSARSGAGDQELPSSHASISVPLVIPVIRAATLPRAARRLTPPLTESLSG